ncbi:MAG TPA: hypothetical protein DF383_08000, partial [Deltaproteobacteria bacterium]|nr:hypothetical protein [Deltaproteobacteria bacterium]
AITRAAKLTWPVLQFVNNRFKDGKSFQPQWAPGPLLKSYERTSPKLGFPRNTDSLCPGCVK